MADYRIVSRHVRYWRGAIHKWSCVYPFVGTIATTHYYDALATIQQTEQAIMWPGSGSGNGGTYENVLYDQASGGVPVAVQTYFDPDSPAAWLPYVGNAWTGTGTALASNAECALQVEWPAGLSKSGKPVRYRKWYHAVPAGNGSTSTPDVSAANQTAIATQLRNGLAQVSGYGLNLGSGSRLAAGTPVVAPYYGNHQMSRGRRRKVSSSSSQAQANYEKILQIIESKAYDDANS